MPARRPLLARIGASMALALGMTGAAPAAAQASSAAFFRPSASPAKVLMTLPSSGIKGIQRSRSYGTTPGFELTI